MSQNNIPVELKHFETFINIIVKLQSENRWRFLFHKNFSSVNLDKVALDKELELNGLDPKQLEPLMRQVTLLLSAHLDNEVNKAITWVIEKFGEKEEIIHQKLKLVVTNLCTDELKRSKKLYESCVFTFLKGYSWGIDIKLLDPERSDESFKVGALNLVLQHNNPVSADDIPESHVNVTLSLSDINMLISGLNNLKEKLES